MTDPCECGNCPDCQTIRRGGVLDTHGDLQKYLAGKDRRGELGGEHALLLLDRKGEVFTAFIDDEDGDPWIVGIHRPEIGGEWSGRPEVISRLVSESGDLGWPMAVLALPSEYARMRVGLRRRFLEYGKHLRETQGQDAVREWLSSPPVKRRDRSR